MPINKLTPEPHTWDTSRNVTYPGSCMRYLILRPLLWHAQCSVGGVSYGTGITEIERAAARREGKPLPETPAAAASSACTVERTLGGSNGLSGGSAACRGNGAESALNDRVEGSGRQGACGGGVPGKGTGGGALSGSRAAPPANGSVPPGSATGVSSGRAGTVSGALGGGTAAPGRAGAPARRAMGFNFVDARLTGGAFQREARPALLREFFRVLAVCHTVIPDGMRCARHAQCQGRCMSCMPSLRWLHAILLDIVRCLGRMTGEPQRHSWPTSVRPQA